MYSRPSRRRCRSCSGNDVIQHLSAAAAHPSLTDSLLPRTPHARLQKLTHSGAKLGIRQVGPPTAQRHPDQSIQVSYSRPGPFAYPSRPTQLGAEGRALPSSRESRPPRKLRSWAPCASCRSLAEAAPRATMHESALVAPFRNRYHILRAFSPGTGAHRPQVRWFAIP
jgi:hypothetical protein